MKTVQSFDNNTKQPGTSTRCLVVLGMHRSGTSALTGVLSLLGIHPGDTLLPAMEGINPKGFWEHAEIVSIHEQLLEGLGSSWNDESPLPRQWWQSALTTPIRDQIIKVLRRDFGNLPIWLIKDPRMCRLLPMWHEIFRELSCQPLYVLSLRSPAEVARSLRKRDDLIEEASCLLWLAHMLEAEIQTRGQTRIFVSYEKLLSDWRGTVANIEKTLGFTWPIAAEKAAPDIEAFLDASLRHHMDGASLSDHPACRLAQQGFELLSTPSSDTSALDRLRLQTAELTNVVSPWSQRLHLDEIQTRSLVSDNTRLTSENARLAFENAELRKDILRIKSSTSWQVTKPLRLIQNISRLIISDTKKS